MDPQGSKIFIRACILAAILVLSGACDQDQQPTPQQVAEPVSIAVSTTPLSAPFYIAAANGYFRDEGLDVNIIDTIGGHRCLDKVLEGVTDMGTSSDYPVMMKSFSRNDYIIASTFVSSANDVKLIASQRQGISNISDLAGKTIGTVTGASSHYFLDRFLLLNNMDLTDVHVIHVDPEAQVSALKNGTVDALSVWEPYAYLARQALPDDSIIFPSGDYYRETFNLVMTRDYLNSHRQQVYRVLVALNRAIAFIRSDSASAQRILATRLKLDQGFIEWIWDDFEFSLTLEQSLLKTLENEAMWAINNGLVQQHEIVNFLDYVDTSVLKQIDAASISIIQ